jgi:hypothetical protein
VATLVQEFQLSPEQIAQILLKKQKTEDAQNLD